MRPSATDPPLGRRTWSGALLGAAGLAGLTALLVPSRPAVEPASVALLYLIPVVAAAVVGGLRPALVAALAADLLVNYFFAPPYHTLRVESRDHLILLVVYILVATAVSVTVELAARYRQRATRQADRARELAEVDRVRSALLAAVGHDLRTPLAAVKAAVSSLRQPDVDLPPDARTELLATIEEGADRLDALIDNLLSMSRLQAGVLSVHCAPIALDAVVGQALLHATGGPTVDVDIPDDLPLVNADAGLLERVVANLVANARAASPPDRPVRLSGDVVDGGVRLRVVDHGPGVPATERDRIFEPFQRLHDRTAGGGLGLGLAIARGFSQAIGATITPSDTPGGGLTMTVMLPVAP